MDEVEVMVEGIAVVGVVIVMDDSKYGITPGVGVVELETRYGVRPVVGGATVEVLVMVERRNGVRPEVVGVAVVVVRSLSLKGKIPLGPVVGGSVVTGSPKYYYSTLIMMMTFGRVRVTSVISK